MEIEYSHKNHFLSLLNPITNIRATHYRSSTCTVGYLMLCSFDHSTVRNHFRSIRELNFMPLTGRGWAKIFPAIRGRESVYKWLPKFDQSTSILELFISFANSCSRTKSDSEHCYQRVVYYRHTRTS